MVKIPDDMVAGTVHKTNNYGDLKVVGYHSRSDVDVEFVATGFKTTAYASHIRSGKVMDYMTPSICGVGFIGASQDVRSLKESKSEAYKCWRRMLDRCYGLRSKLPNSNYSGCIVCDSWHNFQNFKKWHNDNYIEGYQLDKDIKVDGNRVYSPGTCEFVSHKKNSEKASAKHYRFTSPIGENVEIYNLSDFCNTTGLTHCNMSMVHGGLRMSHKGWTKA